MWILLIDKSGRFGLLCAIFLRVDSANKSVSNALVRVVLGLSAGVSQRSTLLVDIGSLKCMTC